MFALLDIDNYNLHILYFGAMKTSQKTGYYNYKKNATTYSPKPTAHIDTSSS
jgi:hypothetical protein